MNKYAIGIILATCFFFLQFLTLSDYGINSDTPFRYMRGQAFLEYLFTGKSRFDTASPVSPVIIKPGEYLSRFYPSIQEDFPFNSPKNITNARKAYEETKQKTGKDFSFYQAQSWNGDYFLKVDQTGHAPLIDLLAAASNRIFTQRLHLLGEIKSYQMVNSLVASMGIFIVVVFASDITGSLLAGFIAGISLMFFPLFFADSHVNLKDPEQAVFFAGVVWGIWNWVQTNKRRWAFVTIGFGVLCFLIKWNIIFLPFILAAWLMILLIRKNKYFREWFSWTKVVYPIVLIVLAATLLLFIWPAKGFSIPERLFSTAFYYVEIGASSNKIEPTGFIFARFDLYLSALLLFQTPILILFLGVTGLYGIFRKNDKYYLYTGILLLSWIILPVVRISLPFASSYGGLRQIMEILPAMAVTSGIGGYCLVRVLESRIKNGYIKIAKTVFCLLALCLLLIPIVRLHPYESAFFNTLAGGLKGAESKHLLDWELSYGVVFKKEIDYLNEHAEKGAKIAFLDGREYAISLYTVRQDMLISPGVFSGFDQKGEYILTHDDSLNPTVFAYKYPLQFLKPVYQIKVDGVVLGSIYKNDHQYSRRAIKEMRIADNLFSIKQNEDKSLVIDLHKKEYPISRIRIINSNPDCIFTSGLIDDEQVDFVKNDHTVSSYSLLERKKENLLTLDIIFPGEMASEIHAVPYNNMSCFVTGKIESLWYLSK